MHTGLAHRAQGADGAREFGFQRVLVAGVFHELADAEARVLFHQFEAAAGFLAGQAGAGQLEAGVVQTVLRHRNGAGALVDLVGNLRGAQQVGRFGIALFVQAGVQRLIARLLRPEEHRQTGRDRQGDHRHHGQLAGDLQAADTVEPLPRLFGVLVHVFFADRECHVSSTFTAACS